MTLYTGAQPYESFAQWEVPTIAAGRSGKPVAEVLIWPGLGGGDDDNHRLVQAGTHQVDNYPNNPYFWYQGYAKSGGWSQTDCPISSLVPHVGDSVAVQVAVSNSSGGMFMTTFRINDYSTSRSLQFTVDYHGASGWQSEVIVERYTFVQLDPLAKFGLLEPYALFTTAKRCIGQYADSQITRLDMAEGGQTLAISRYLDSLGCTFKSTWMNYGQVG